MSKALSVKVLVVNGSKEDEALYRLFLGKHELVMVPTVAAAHAALHSEEPDVIIFDPGSTEPEGEYSLESLAALTDAFLIAHTTELPALGTALVAHRWLLKPQWEDMVRHIEAHLCGRYSPFRTTRPSTLPNVAWCSLW